MANDCFKVVNQGVKMTRYVAKQSKICNFTIIKFQLGKISLLIWNRYHETDGHNDASNPGAGDLQWTD